MPTICCRKKPQVYPPSKVLLDNYWIVNGVNMLKGCCNDLDNPIKLDICFILHALEHVGIARRDFCRLWPALLPCEQERFKSYQQTHPSLFKRFAEPVLVDDMRMIDRIRKLPIHTVGPNGGLTVPNPICQQPIVPIAGK